MKYIKASNRIEASKHDWAHLRCITHLKPQTVIPELGCWRQQDDEFLWRSIVGQICNRGGVAWRRPLERSGQMDDFRESLSLRALREMKSEKRLRAYVAKQMEAFHVGRFRSDNTRSVVANLAAFADADGHLSELRKRLDELDCTGEAVGPSVQARERKARTFLMERLIFYHKGVKRYAKRKPPSDFLINTGFARTLIPFDSRMRKVFKELFGLRVSDENYEAIEDWFLSEAYPALHITPSEFDRVVFQHTDEILKRAAQSASGTR